MKSIVQRGLAMAAGLLFCVAGATAQDVMMQKAVIAPAGGSSTDGTTTMTYTLGQPVVGTASNSQMTGTFGFWNEQLQVSSVTGTVGAGAIASITVAPAPLVDNGRVTLRITTAGALDVSLYNATGERVLELFRGNHEAGTITLPISTEGLSSGAYFIAARTPGAMLQVPVTITQ